MPSTVRQRCGNGSNQRDVVVSRDGLDRQPVGEARTHSDQQQDADDIDGQPRNKGIPAWGAADFVGERAELHC